MLERLRQEQEHVLNPDIIAFTKEAAKNLGHYNIGPAVALVAVAHSFMCLAYAIESGCQSVGEAIRDGATILVKGRKGLKDA